MQYSIEESALIGGLITEYFSRASVSDSVRLAYRQVYQHLMDGHLTQDDLGQIQAALDLLPPDRGNNGVGDTRLVFQAPAGFSVGVSLGMVQDTFGISLCCSGSAVCLFSMQPIGQATSRKVA